MLATAKGMPVFHSWFSGCRLASASVLPDVSLASPNVSLPLGSAGVKRVLHVNHPSHQTPVAELLAPLIVALQKHNSFTHVLAPASTFGKNLIPRVGGLLDVAPISEVMGRLLLGQPPVSA
jgi:hypothetical protein